jgi:hypothetical protein
VEGGTPADSRGDILRWPDPRPQCRQIHTRSVKPMLGSAFYGRIGEERCSIVFRMLI